MAGLLTGKVAVVTGGTSGIGLATALLLAREGARVAITGRDPRRGARAVEQIREETDDVLFLAGEASSRADNVKIMNEVAARWGRIDVLVANAGVGLVTPLIDTEEADFDRLMAVNVKGYLLAVQAARAHMTGEEGSVVLISSDAGVLGEPSVGAYSVSKAAVIMMGKMLAVDLAPRIRVNVVCPGDTVPGMRYMLKPGQQERPEGDYLSWPLPPLGRWGRAEDVAAAVLFFCSPASAFCTGSVLLVDGGARARFPL